MRQLPRLTNDHKSRTETTRDGSAKDEAAGFGADHQINVFASEGIGEEPLLSVWLLRGLLPVQGRELEDAALRPGRKEAEEIAQVRPGFEAAELTSVSRVSAVLTVKQVAGRLGISTSLVYALCGAGAIPHTRILCSAYSQARQAVSAFTPPLAAA